MRKGLSWLVALFALGACVGVASAQYPVTYAFPGSSAPAGFTTPVTGISGTVVNSSGNATLVSVGGTGAAAYTGVSFVSFGVHDQHATVSYTSGSGFEPQGNTSPGVNMTAGGNGVIYSGAQKGFMACTAGSCVPTGTLCFFSASNSTTDISVVGNNYTATDNFGNSCTRTITGFSGTGSPGFLLDQTTDSTTRIQNFVGDCYPASCGTVATPTITPATGSYISTQTVTITSTTPSAVIAYTIDGSTPTCTSGTVTHGTTYSGTFSTSGTTPYTETVKAVGCISGGTTSPVASNAITVTGIVVQTKMPGGTIMTLAINVAGSGYAVNDTFNFVQTGNTQNGGEGMVTAVSGGVPTAIAICTYPTCGSTMNGTGYSTATAVPTSANSPSTGTGLTVNITVVVAPSFLVFPGSTRQIMVTDNSPTDTITWTASGATVSSPNNLQTALVTIGATTGTCSITPATGNPGPYTVSSTQVATVTATSVTDPTRSATFVFNVCQTLDQVQVDPDYQQAWPGIPVELVGRIFGVALANESATWSITTQPSGGNGTLTDTTTRNTWFSATVPGKYVITSTENVSPHNTATGVVWVTATSYPYPAYPLPNGTMLSPIDCTDPSFTSTVDIGPGQTFTTISAAITGAVAAGTCFRLHNPGGSTPTTYPEYVQWISAATQANPIYFGGIPDSSGYEPIIEGHNATGNAGIANAYERNGVGIFEYYSHGYSQGSCNSGYPGECGPSHIIMANLHIHNADLTTPYYVPGSPTITSISRSGNVVTAVVSAVSSYGQFLPENINVVNVTGGSTSFNGQFSLTGQSGTTLTWAQTGANESGTVSGTSAVQLFWGGGCIDHETGDHNSFFGIEFEECPQGIFANDNAGSHLWGGISDELTVLHGNFNDNGTPLTQSIHGTYLEGRNITFIGNHIHDPASGVLGGAMKVRAVNNWYEANIATGGWARCMDRVEVQSGYLYVDIVGYLAIWGGSGDTGGAQVVAAMQEALHQDVRHGNVCDTTAAQVVHIAEDVDSGVVTPTGQFFDQFNTDVMNNGSQSFVYENNSNNGLPFYDYFNLRVHSANNSQWGPGAGSNFQINTSPTFIADLTTNMYDTGAVVYSGTINTGATGWGTQGDGCPPTSCPWADVLPMNLHMTGLTSGNFLFTASNPITTNYVPITSSPLNNAATALTGLQAQIRTRYFYDLSKNALSLRTDLVSNQPTTIGAVPGSGSPPPSNSLFFGGHIKLSGSVKAQ